MSGALLDPNKTTADNIPKTGKPEFDKLSPAAQCVQLSFNTKQQMLLSDLISTGDPQRYREDFNKSAHD